MDTINIDLLLKILIAAIGGLIWFLRLEGRLIYQERIQKTQAEQIEKLENDQKELQTQIHMINSDIVKQLGEIKQSIARIEGRLAAQGEQ